MRLIQVQREAISLHEHQSSGGGDAAAIGDVSKLRQVQQPLQLSRFARHNCLSAHRFSSTKPLS